MHSGTEAEGHPHKPRAADPDVHTEAIGSVSRLVGEPVTGVMVGCYGIDFSIRSAPRVLMMSSGRLLTIRRSV